MAQQENGGKLTIRDIASALDVSTTTVSRAISGKGRIGADTRERVRKYIAASNYVPNAIAQSLAGSRTWNLGFVVPDAVTVAGQAFFRGCLTGICAELSGTEYDVLVLMDESGDGVKLERALERGKLDGAILSRAREDDPIGALLKSREVPYVVIGSPPDPVQLQVDHNHRAACGELTALLLKRCRRLALLGGERQLVVNRHRLQGFLDGHAAAGRPVEEDLLYFGVNTPESAAAAAEAALSAGTDCLVCMDDYVCGLVLSQLHHRGLRAPEDIGVASFYDSAYLRGCVPPVTALQFDERALGAAACRLLLKRLEGRVEGPERVQVGYQLALRRSTWVMDCGASGDRFSKINKVDKI